jgi:hypothetical protein
MIITETTNKNELVSAAVELIDTQAQHIERLQHQRKVILLFGLIVFTLYLL